MARLFRKSSDAPARSLWQRIRDVALMDVGVAVRGVKQGSLERLEEILLEADFGVPTTIRLVEAVERRAERGEVRSQDEFLAALRAGVERALRAGNSDPALTLPPTAPAVIVVAGVNGA